MRGLVESTAHYWMLCSRRKEPKISGEKLRSRSLAIHLYVFASFQIHHVAKFSLRSAQVHLIAVAQQDLRALPRRKLPAVEKRPVCACVDDVDGTALKVELDYLRLF